MNSLFVPRGVHVIIFCDFLVDLLRLLRIDLLDELCWYARVDTAWLDDGLTQDDRARGDDGALPNDRVIKYHGAHTDKRAMADLGAMDRYVMTDRHIVANLNGRFLIQGMKDGTILDIDPIADADGIDVAAKDGAKPDTASLANLDITDDGRVIREKRILADFRRKASY